ncbi:RagB/SusD family nutrient uptake outer membrane protein [uncultured Aquimarina sp.]|uniref:RagB/SusD family nutrient uptake outer membrane protein n=1 Tax=uncultured Aquimarina sp. TaxID=575652 RepID=UPI002639A83B|nr:RagB/SusD family nutrient uptake outer membrane protein [uncultured Aquimarina sp.]
MKHIFKFRNRNINLKICVLFTITLFTLSCDLDEEVISFRTDSNFYANQDELNRGVIATYSGLYEVLEAEWSVTEQRSDNTFTDPDASPESNFQNFTLDRYQVETNNTLNQEYYAASYKAIALANRVIANLDVAEDESLRNQYEGEAKFIRALLHFNLTRLYGSIIISDQIVIGEEGLLLARQAQTEVYDFIIQDLLDAVAFLPDSYDESEFGRATSIAARTILGKVYLTSPERDLEAAITQLEYVRDQSDRDLVNNYDLLFDENNEINEEVIFSVRYETGLIGLGSIFPNLFAPVRSTGSILGVFGDGDGRNIPSEDMSNAYEVGDVRKASSMADGFTIENDDGPEDDEFRLDKYVLKYNPTSASAVEDGPVDFPVTRYADVLLMLSEAYVDARGISEALTEFNKVRVRADLEPLTEADTPSSFAFRLALEQERRVEFAFENHRLFDLLRTGRTLAVLNAHFNTEFAYNDPDNPDRGAGPIANFQLLLPIPQREIDNNPNLAQNIGY